MLIKLKIDMIIVPQNDNSEFTKSIDTIEKEVKKCDFCIILITYENRFFKKTNNFFEAYQEMVQPNLSLLLEMGYLISHFGKQKTIIVEFSPIEKDQIKKTTQFNIDPTLIHYQSFNTNLIIDEILKMTNNIN
ncbi:hypothetical protein DDB_G0287321 [Dictyostelium discoideum AX4]|uniref:CD-NTase-associated protein 12/Pycsar effector protein TIR domain-containing protein n=1 Tax=Dictyostelium discoideum TaxID=44689 RepID=Q54KI8_DICDI|nr:hypothetical protein DDB_G0287321 [Dictyostelium discoideum AX4]EAL63728.1 hypothetical protein DDB_G0287321 [Dictyostelium discoideum AX4]|eukprot:XP_637235.1 hypothetical protein DDB_G0287321 [Dictyostelium discoideum AX4]